MRRNYFSLLKGPDSPLGKIGVSLGPWKVSEEVSLQVVLSFLKYGDSIEDGQWTKEKAQ